MIMIVFPTCSKSPFVRNEKRHSSHTFLCFSNQVRCFIMPTAKPKFVVSIVFLVHPDCFLSCRPKVRCVHRTLRAPGQLASARSKYTRVFVGRHVVNPTTKVLLLTQTLGAPEQTKHCYYILLRHPTRQRNFRNGWPSIIYTLQLPRDHQKSRGEYYHLRQ